MRVILTGGGTAGHINPALAIAEIIRRNDPSAEVLFVGIKGGKEEDLVPREGYRLEYVKSMGIRRSLSPANIKALWLAWYSPRSAATKRILEEFRPDIVIGTGGYACWPIMSAAAKRGIPTALHESNALPGMAVKRLQGSVDRIWINFAATADRLKDQTKVLRVGNPLRGGFGTLTKEDARRLLGLAPEQKLILSFGGSLGAEGVTRAVLEMMQKFTARQTEYLHLHAAGKRDHADAKQCFEALGLGGAANCRLADYIYDMPLQMAAADLVISRAGAMTLSELAEMKKPCILIPSPNVADNHQYVNAKTLSDAGAAVLVEEKNLAEGALLRAAESLLADPARMAGMQESIAAFADRDADRLIWEDIRQLLDGKKRS